jgi:hypothetical protein
MSRVARPNPGGVSIRVVVCWVTRKHVPAVRTTVSRALSVVCARCGKELA